MAPLDYLDFRLTKQNPAGPVVTCLSRSSLCLLGRVRGKLRVLVGLRRECTAGTQGRASLCDIADQKCDKADIEGVEMSNLPDPCDAKQGMEAGSDPGPLINGF
jgi:hypothetical protein